MSRIKLHLGASSLVITICIGLASPSFAADVIEVEEVTEETVIEDENEFDSYFGEDGFVQLSLKTFDTVLDFQDDVSGKAEDILRFRQDGTLKTNKLTVGTILKGSYMYEKSNEDGKFPILSRLPDQHSDDDEDSRPVLNHAAWGGILTLGEWLTAYAQIEYIDTRYPGQSDIQLRKAYGIVGNLDKYPVYAKFGRDTIDFGNFESFNPITHSVGTHFFWALSDDPVLALGYSDHGLHAVATLIPGGRQKRTADSEGSSVVGNFALNATYTFEPMDNLTLRLGAGYLHNTIYNTLIPHHTDTGPVGVNGQERTDNPAWDVNLYAAYNDFEFMAEYTATFDDWPATGAIVSAATVQGRYTTDIMNFKTAFSLVYSRGDFGPDGSEFEFMDQSIAGVEVYLDKHLSLSAEYVHNRGFAPLVNITRTSDQSVESNTFIVGGRLVF